MSCDHEASPNPRATGACVKCGHLIENGRNAKFELDFLEHAAHRAGLGSMGFESQVLSRLSMHPGAEFLRYPLARLLVEIGQEGEDIAGWAVGAAQCDELATLDEERRQQVLAGLVDLAAVGAMAEARVRRLKSMLE